MAKYNVHAGHNSIVPGASKYLNEVTEDRKVKNKVIQLLKAAGHTVYDCTDASGKTSGANLANIVAKCNKHTVDLDISIHLNAGGGTGTEVFYYTGSSSGKKKAAGSQPESCCGTWHQKQGREILFRAVCAAEYKGYSDPCRVLFCGFKDRQG